MATSAWLISTAALHPSIADLGVAIVGVRAFGLARGVGRYLERYLSHSVTLSLLSRLRVWFFEKLEPLAPARLMEFHGGDILSRAVADIDSLQDLYVRALAPPLVAVLVVATMGLWYLTMAPALAAILVLFMLAAGLGLPVAVQRLSRHPSETALALRAELRSLIVDAIQGVPDILAFGQEKPMRDRIARAGGRLVEVQRRVARIDSLQASLSELLSYGGMWAVLAVAIGLRAAGQVPGVMLAPVVLATLAAYEAVAPLPLAARAWESGREAARRLYEIIDAEPTVREPSDPLEVPSRPDLAVRSLSFRYSPGDKLALHRVSFEARPGEKVAVVGPSGAGKSTLVHLLLRFWDYESGAIELDGIDIRAFSSSDLRSWIGVISQEPYLFTATILENLLLARPDATMGAVKEAVEGAQLSEFVSSLPDGYDTWIGEHGLNLSGGERQRLAIARTLLRGPQFLVLDEPTANLDPATERAVLQSILDASGARTLLLITHRLVGLAAMDKILVLDRGRVVERGSHAELLRKDGVYRRLWTLQNRAFLEPS